MSCDASSDSPNFCTQITSNPDIAGVGVRSAIYTQTLLSMCIASFLPNHEKAFRDTCRNSYIVSGSLIVASLIAWNTDQLSLFDALIVSMLTTLMTAFVTVNGPYIRTLGLSINFACLLFASFWCYWGLQIWSNPSAFGLPSDGQNCTANVDTQFIVFGRSVGATSHGLQGFALFIFSAGSISALWALWTTVTWAFKYAAIGAKTARDNAAYAYAAELRAKGVRGQHVNRFGGFVGLVYMIVTTEQIVARNSEVHETLQQWSFGQTLALIMVTVQLMDCATYVKEWNRFQNQEQKRKRAQSHV